MISLGGLVHSVTHMLRPLRPPSRSYLDGKHRRGGWSLQEV